MSKILFVISILIGFTITCSKQDDSLKVNAEIIGFNPEKCMCCWGWIIKMGNDTIKSDNVIIGETVGYDIDNPVSVYIELGEIDHKCSTFGFINPDYDRDFYEIKTIKKFEK